MARAPSLASRLPPASPPSCWAPRRCSSSGDPFRPSRLRCWRATAWPSRCKLAPCTGDRPEPFAADRHVRSCCPALRLGLRAYPLLFLPYLLIKSDILLVRWLRGAAETGIYSVAGQAVDVLLLLPSTIAAVALPSIVRAARPRDEFVRVVRPTLLLSVGLALLVAAFGYWPILIVFGRPYVGAYSALLFLLPGFLCLALQSVLSQYFAARRFPLILSAFWLAGIAVNTTLNLAFVPVLGVCCRRRGQQRRLRDGRAPDAVVLPA